MVEEFFALLNKEELRKQFLNPEVMGCAGAILQLLHEKGLPFDKWENALRLALRWLQVELYLPKK